MWQELKETSYSIRKTYLKFLILIITIYSSLKLITYDLEF